MATCKHSVLRHTPSRHASNVDYQEPIATKRLAATQLSNKAVEGSILPSGWTFPSPLVLPDDELSWNLKEEPQSLRSWARTVNQITDQRRTVYVVLPPKVTDELSFLTSSPTIKTKPQSLQQPSFEHVTAYLAAFYHGLPVKVLQRPALAFCKWEEDEAKTATRNIGLSDGTQAIRIRSRESPDHIFTNQLHLNDVLDVAIEILPTDAYALLMLVEHDLYEDDEDDFCCGRAYGGSRVAVVSMARYNPTLDSKQSVERHHAWPASHCDRYVHNRCLETDEEIVDFKSRKDGSNTSALRVAVDAFTNIRTPWSVAELTELWLSRVCKTASHELGHCFGIGHCSYFACVMQGTAGLSEDARQPPYLCPVDVAKVLALTGAKEMDHYDALLRFCQKFKTEKMFAAFAAWLEVRRSEMK